MHQPAAISGLLQLRKRLENRHQSHIPLVDTHTAEGQQHIGPKQASASQLWISSTTGLLHAEICWRMVLPQRLQAILATCGKLLMDTKRMDTKRIETPSAGTGA